MIRLVIFGTGSSGESAWSAAEDTEGVQVVAFADNNLQRQGTVFHRRPVWSAEQLAASTDWDRVIAASQWHREIVAQLVKLGIPQSHAVAFRAADTIQRLVDRTRSVAAAAVGDGRIRARSLPRVLILTYETLNQSHGTGVLLQRYFGDFPRDHLMSISHSDAGPAWLERAAIVRGHGPVAVREVKRLLESFTPDLIYATALNEADLDLLEVVRRAMARPVPIIQHFMDFIPQDEFRFLKKFRRLLPVVTELWSLTEALQQLLEAKLGRTPRLVTGLLQRVPEYFHDQHVEFGRGFRTVMVGNFYNVSVIPYVREVWARCREQLPELGPIEWLVAPQRLQDLLDRGADPGLDFVWRGFFKGGRLQRQLAEADLALLPLNQGSEATSHYLRYSLPSRLAEFACVGVPVLAIASADTPLAAFVRRHGIGRVVGGQTPEAAAAAIVAFIRDRAARTQAGAAGRQLANDQFRIERFRAWFNQRLLEVVRRSRASVPRK